MADLSAKQLGLTKSSLPNSIIEVISTLTKAGFEAYIVGGGVRDNLLGLNPKDFDAVTNAKPNEIKAVFGKRCRIIGRRFQLAHVYSGREMIEVATFRAPPTGDKHTTMEGMLVRDNVWGDIKQDASRRDFSINALYYQPLKGIVKDFCHAIDDIENHKLRLLGHASTRIEEDPVRLLRALRFKAKLNFEFDNELTQQFNDKNWALLDQVSPHRLYDETQKMFIGGYIVPLLPILYEYKAIEHLFIYPDSKPSKLVTQVAINTDKRIASGKSINPAFFYAAMLWGNYLYQLNKYKKGNIPFVDAQQKAASKVIDRQRLKTSIPKFAEQFIREVWLLQHRLVNPRAKHIMPLIEHPKFRAGFDFLLLREICGESDTPLAEPTNGMGAWWQEFQTLTEKQKRKQIDKFAKKTRRGGDNRRSRRLNGVIEDVVEKSPVNSATITHLNSVDVDGNKQAKQDSQKTAQLEMLSLTRQSNKKSKQLSSLFMVDGTLGVAVNQKTKSKKSVNKPANKAKNIEVIQQATSLESLLLDTNYVPRVRQRKKSI